MFQVSFNEKKKRGVKRQLLFIYLFIYFFFFGGGEGGRGVSRYWHCIEQRQNAQKTCFLLYLRSPKKLEIIKSKNTKQILTILSVIHVCLEHLLDCLVLTGDPGTGKVSVDPTLLLHVIFIV